MLLWSEQQWAAEVQRAGFDVLDQWRSGKSESNQEGTMTIIARNRNTASDSQRRGDEERREQGACDSE
jgi:hypothetical protein